MGRMMSRTQRYHHDVHLVARNIKIFLSFRCEENLAMIDNEDKYNNQLTIMMNMFDLE
jgi:hypothetical protein